MENALEAQPEAAHTEIDEVKKLKIEIIELLLHGRERRLAIGRLLIRLHALLAKQGSGTFMKTVTDELHIPYSTATGYMIEAGEADNPRSYEIRNNDSTQDGAATASENDPQAEAVEAAKATEREVREEAKRQRKFSNRLRVDFVTQTSDQPDRCKKKIKQLGIGETFIRFYNALFPEAPLPTGTKVPQSGIESADISARLVFLDVAEQGDGHEDQVH